MNTLPTNPGAESPSPMSSADLLNYARQHLTVIAIVIGAVLLVALVAAGYGIQQRRNADRASQMLSVAQNQQQLEEVLMQYPSTPAAPMALLAVAAGSYAAGAYDQAANQYTQFQQKYPRHPLAVAAELGQVQCQEGRGDVDQALGGYMLFITTHPDHYLTTQALFGKARCLQLARRYAEARAVYEDFIAAHPTNDWTPQAEMNLRLLEKDLRVQAPTDKVAPASR